jgi:capsular exopolysaccharide synthesis family protein
MADTPHLQAADVDLSDYLEIIQRRKWIIVQTFAVVTAIGLITTMMTTPIYRATAKLKVEAAPLTITTQNSDNPLATILSQAQPDSVETQMQMLQTGPFVRRVLDAAVVVQVESPSPQEAAHVAQEMLKLHEDESYEHSAQGLKGALAYVRRESDKSKKALDDAETHLIEFRKKKHVTEMSAEQESQIKKYVEMESQLQATQSNIIRLQAEINNIQTQLLNEPEQTELPVVNENPRFSQLAAQIDDLKQRRVALLQLYQENNYRVRNLDAELAALQERFKQEPEEKKSVQRIPNPARGELRARMSSAKAERRGLLAAHDSLAAAVSQGGQMMANMGPMQVMLAHYNRERDVAESAYKELESRRRELELRNNAFRDTAVIIEPATVPMTPVRPRKTLNLMFASLMGLCLGVSMAFLQEFLDDRVNSPEDADRIVRLPVLGHIPRIGEQRPRLMHTMPLGSSVAESYRALRSGIGFAAVDKPLQTLLVTSSHQGEGKSLTSVNLAISMAMDRRQVILIDADLRRPNVHNILQLVQTPGLSELLVDQVSLEDALQETPVEGLRVISSGSQPPNPAELLNSARMEELMERLRGIADLVIIDSPPCALVTDAQVLAPKVDGTVLVLEIGEAKKGQVRYAKGILDQSRARLLGLVLNKISASATYGSYSPYTSNSGYYTNELANGHSNGRRGGRKVRALAPAHVTAEDDSEPERRGDRPHAAPDEEL